MYIADQSRYDHMTYRRCGNSGLKLPLLSLGLWHNFGGVDHFDTARSLLIQAFDKGITHFDLANNYGPPPGSAETTLGKVLKTDLFPYRDELIISTKAGYDMWPGPYGDWGSKKYLLASLDQSLKRMGLDYVDIFYSHRLDPKTPLEETMEALAQAVRHGKTLYAGISNYPPEQTRQAANLLKQMGVRCLIHQNRYSMFYREPEKELLQTIRETGMGCIAFSPLAQGLLTNRYLVDIPADSRASKSHGFLKSKDITKAVRDKINALNQIASKRGQTLAQMALAWVLRDDLVVSVLIGASKPEQLDENLRILENNEFTADELKMIDSVLSEI